ncbi:MAG: HmuY family protein [Stagnimonas sp.]|nr:HmuY family protein [Stagnimonas sp.]
MNRIALPLAAAWLLSACAGELHLPPSTAVEGDPVATPTLPGPGGAQSSFAASGSSLYTGKVDATGADWIYLDLETQKQIVPANPAASGDWDLAFKGSEVKLNGGSSGTPPGGHAVRLFGDKVAEGVVYPFAQITGAPTETAVEYQTDTLTAAGPLDGLIPGLSTGGQPVYAMTTYPEADQSPGAVTRAGDYGWYRDAGLAGMNAITVRGNVAYVIRSVECRYYKLRMTAYADAGGVAGHPAFEFGEIPGPVCSSGGGSSAVAPLGRAVFTATSNSWKIAIDATDEDAWVHIDLTAAQQVVPSNPDNDANSWDIAFKRTDIKANSGASGSGTVAIADGLRDSWETRTAAYTDTAKYHVDAADALAFITYPAAERTGDTACGGINSDFGWYYYSGFCNDGDGVHHISPREVVYVVKGRDGNYWKLRMLDYYDAAGSSAHPSVEFAPVTKP